MEANHILRQIEKIAQNARATWFGLLALVVFVGVTLMGHQDSDFFAFGAETQLPFLNISVQTSSFFIAAPVLMAALYVYLHIYLNTLWTALRKCPPQISGAPLEEHVYPAMLCTSALVLRRRLRCQEDEPVEGGRYATVAITFAMTWLFAPVVLGVLWWRSMPYHSELLTLWISLCLWLALAGGGLSLVRLFYEMSDDNLQTQNAFRRNFGVSVLSAVFAALAAISWDTTEGGYVLPLARANLGGAELSQKPKDWLFYEIWLEDWEERFRKREAVSMTQPIDQWPEGLAELFRRETEQRWATLTRSLDSPNLQGVDLRGADLRDSFLSGIDFTDARLEGADLLGARMEGTVLHGAHLEDANLTLTRLEGANLHFARLTGASLREARLTGANVTFAGMFGAILQEAYLKGADFRGANMDGADLSRTRTTGSNFRSVDLSKIKNTTPFNLYRVFGDIHTTLPEHLEAPCHWDRSTLTPYLDADAKYLSWLSRGAIMVIGTADGDCPQVE